LSFARKYDPRDIEQAANLCLENKLSGYRAVKNILEHKIKMPQELTAALIQNHESIRSATEYHSLWNKCTQTLKEKICL